MTQGRRLQYGYDNAGNQIARSVPGAADKSWVQTWDYENRLAKVTRAKGAELRLVNGVTKDSSWSYVYDNENIALEIYTDENGLVTKTFYTHGPSVDEPLALERGGQYYFYHADGLGSIASITDASRSIVQSYSYEAFGMAKPSTLFRNSYTYTGREWDKETGLYYYRARYYDPMEGRFISKDPIGFDGGDVNLYGYVHSNPINKIDPFGLSESTSSCVLKCVFNPGPDVNNEGKGGATTWFNRGNIIATIGHRFIDCYKQCECVDNDCKCRKSDKIGDLQDNQPINTPIHDIIYH